ncbi:MAG: putative heme iron utilization protein [Labilithrix sp.]|nr:putative heme iron utilization protein [Labilithrix sp.]
MSSENEPSHAARCRDLVSRARHGTLCTIARDPAGFPFGSLVAIAADEAGRPLFLLSSLAEHTKNLLAGSEASLLVAEPAPAGADPLALGRVTILGRVRPVPPGELHSALDVFLAHQPEAATYVTFADFAFYRLEPEQLRYVGGFGRMSWVSAEEYREATP